MKILSRRAWLVIGAITLAYVIALIVDISPYVRGPEEWRWERWAIPHWDRVWPLAIVLVGVGLLVRWVDRRAQREPARRWIAIGVTLLIVAAPLVQLASLRVVKLNPFEALFDRAVDVAANSYFTAGVRLTDDVNQALRTYPQLMPTLDIHAQVHPPGLPLIYWAAGRVFEAAPALARPVSLWFRQLECNDINLMLLSDASLASALAGMLLPLLANMLTVWCAFKLAGDRFGKRAGLYAAALWVIVPSAVLFPGSWSLVYPCLAGLTWLAVDAGLRRRNAVWFLSAGLLLSLGTFLELGTAALSVFLVAYLLVYYVLARRNPLTDWRFLIPALIVTLIGVFSIWIVYQLIYGVSLKQIVEAMYPIHIGYEFDRLTWIFNHPYEFAVFVGLPVFCLAVVAFVRNVQAARSGSGDALTISFLIALIGLSLFDPARDETARTWMLFMPLAVVVAAQFFADARARPDRLSWLWGLMVIQVVTMLAVLEVVIVGLSGLPPRTTIDAVPSSAQLTAVDFGGMARLIGYDLEQHDRQVTLDWYWQRENPIDHPYVVFNHLIDAQGQIAAQQDSRPQDGQPLMTCWQPSEIYRDRHVIELPDDLPGGVYRLRMGLYNAVTGWRVPVTGSLLADQIEIGPIAVTR